MRRQRGNDHSGQLTLSFSQSTKTASEKVQSPERGHAVVRFVDAATLAVRQDAVRRVQSTGIFTLSHSVQSKK
jgi:hypothetical protein